MNRPSVDDSLHAPPRILLWLIIVIFFLLVVAGLAGVSFFSGGERLVSLIPFAGIAVVGVLVAAVGGAVAFRRSLPRLLWLWVSIGALLVLVALAFGSITVYRSVLPPRYQEQVLTEIPYMRVFLPPTPEGGTLPTVPPHTDAISPQDLLAPPPLDVPTEETTALPTTAATTQPILIVAPTATPLASATATSTQAVTATSAPTNDPPTATPQGAVQAQQVAAISRPSSGRIYGFTYVKQGWNDCGPANITMALSHYGWTQTQDYAANILKPDPEDKNVSPAEMVAFVRDQTEVTAITRIGGDMELLKDFIAANIPVIVETLYMPEGENWYGHYQTVVGYDDNHATFFIYDSLLGAGTDGQGMPERYDAFDTEWQAFNRTFIAIYEKDREATVQQILGDRADLTKSYEHALVVAQQEATANQQNAFAWFNLGTAYDKLGQYDKAATAYDHAILLNLPYRMLWYQFGPFEAYFETGRYDDVMALVNNNLRNAGPYVEETFYWEGRVLAAQGHKAEAATAFQTALSHNPNYQAARDALAALNT